MKKIKEYRSKLDITQKDLADKLHVTYQAVSRWEKDEVEPSISTLKDMCNIFNCIVDDLFGMEKAEEKKEEVVEKKPLGICNRCNKPLYEGEIETISYRTINRGKRENHNEKVCKKCFEKYLVQEEEQSKRWHESQRKYYQKRRIHSYIWPGLVAILFILFGIFEGFAIGENEFGWDCMAIAVASYTFIATMILKNTFVTMLWLRVCSWGVIKFPGIIFNFSLDGLKFLIGVKLLFWLIGIVFGFVFTVLATLLAMLVSIPVYPFALIRNIKQKEEILP